MYNFESIETQVSQELELMRSYVQSHQGEVELVSVENYNVVIRLKGTCTTCPLSFYTVTVGLEQNLQKKVHPDIRVSIEE